MTGSAFEAMDVVVACLSYEMGGGLEEGGLQIRPDRRPADDGKRLQVMDVVLCIASRRDFVRMGRRSGGGGAKNRTGGRVGG